MTLTTKSARRLILLAGALAALAIVAFGYFVVHRRMQARLSSGFRAESIRALEAHQHYEALNAAASYLARLPDKGASDPDILLVYARARAKVEEPDGKHLIEAIKFYQLYLEKGAQDTAARRELLDLLLTAGLYPEARDLAPTLRPKDLADCSSSDVPVLIAELKAVYASRAAEERVRALLDRLEQLDALSIDASIIRLDVLAQQGKRESGVELAQRLSRSHADDPRAGVVLAMAYLQTGKSENVQRAARLLADCAGLDEVGRRIHPCALTSADDVRRLVESLDLLRLHAHATEVLKEKAEPLGDVRLRRALARRLWQDGQLDDLLARYGSLSPAAGSSDTELIGFAALARLDKGDKPAAAAVAEVLRSRKGDPRINTWRTILEQWDQVRTAPSTETIESIRAAIRMYRGEPILHHMLAENLSALGRFDEARASWRAALQARDNLGDLVALGWATPLLRTAETLLDEGRGVEAARAASEALQEAPARLATNVVFLEAHAARLMLRSTEGPSVEDLLSRLAQVEQALASLAPADAAPFRDRLIPTRVALLARAGRTDEARAFARERMGADPKPSAATLRRIAAVSSAESLGIEREAMTNTERSFGASAEVLFARATDLAQQGKTGEGAQILRDAIAQHPTDAAYAIALARYLEGRDAAGSIAAWDAVLQKFGTQPLSVRAVLRSPAAAQDRALIERAASAFVALAGKDGGEDPVVRIARARSLLSGNVTKDDRDRAVALLGDTVAAAPTLMEARLLLAAALAMNDPGAGIEPESARAVEALNAALVVDPRSSDVLIELGRLELVRGNLTKSREALEKAASDRSAEPDARRRAAELLVAQGAFKPAADALQSIADAEGDATPLRVLVLLAECARAQRDLPRATALYERVATRANDLETLFIAARFFAGRGDQAKVDSLLARIGAINDQPWVLPLARARLAADRGLAQAAVSAFEDAARQGPTVAEVWRTYADFLLRRGDAGGSASVADRGLAAVPKDPALLLLREQARMMQNPDADADLTPLIQAIDANPEHAGVREVLQAIQQARVRGELNTPERLRQLTQRFPSSVPLLMFVARKLEPLDAGEALLVAQRAMQMAPGDPSPARLSAELCLRQQRWPEMLRAASEWRQRESSPTPEPDLALAEAYLGLGQNSKGIEALQPHLAHASESPNEALSLAVLGTQARLLIASGREPQARALLRPLLAENSPVRTYVWLNVATRSLSTYDLAQQWVDEVRRAVAPDLIEENLQIASAMAALGARFPDRAQSISTDIHAILKMLLDNPKTSTAAVHEADGIFRQREGDVPGARAAYTRAIELDPARSVALNNLADLLLREEKFDEALALAKRAVAAAPMQPSHLDTLGSVYADMAARKEREGDLATSKTLAASAAEAFRRLTSLSPADHRPLIRYADLSSRAGDDKAAQWAYERVLSMQALPATYAPALKNNLALVLLRLSRTPSDATRALLLASEALKAQDIPPIRDTLAWAQLAAGQREAAIATFREVLASIKEPTSDASGTLHSARLGLAKALASGSESDRTEARSLLASVPATGLSQELSGKRAGVVSLLAK